MQLPLKELLLPIGNLSLTHMLLFYVADKEAAACVDKGINIPVNQVLL